MIFGIDDGVLDIKKLEGFVVNDDYRLVTTKQVNESEMFRVFKKNKNILESKWRIDHRDLIEDDSDGIAVTMRPLIGGSLTVASKQGVRPNGSIFKGDPHVQVQHRHLFPFKGSYIIPKMFGYFPFLDCDDENTYTEAKFQLATDNIPYTAYKSNLRGNHYWIFCDKQGELDETIDFIESYPCDHRYPWLARHKRELCVRAIPKENYTPVHDEDYLSDEFTDDFAYWNSQFVKYWDSGLIPNYIDMLNAVDVI